MQFVTFIANSGRLESSRLGILQGPRVIDVNAAYNLLLIREGLRERSSVIADAVLPPDLLAYLEGGEIARRALVETLEFVAEDVVNTSEFERVTWEIGAVSLLAPIVRPRSIREFGRFPGHLTAARKTALPESYYAVPFYWKGNPNSTIGPEAEIPWPSYASELDYELEIAAVIGRPGIDIAPEAAMSHVAGFTIFNDVSARDYQRIERGYQNYWGKGKDFCNIFGPTLTTCDEVNYSKFAVTVRVNGETWTVTDTSDMSSTWAELIAHCSKDEWLFPGDIFTSGTVTGCCGTEHLGVEPPAQIMNPGDIVELSVEGIGTLRNTFGPRPESA